MSRLKLSGLVLVSGCVLMGQTSSPIDMQTQVKNVNFSSAPYTRPVKTGTALPAVCGVGDLYFKTDAAAGANLYACTSTNVWTVETGSGAASAVRPGVTATATGATLTVGTDCSVSTPCNVRFTNRVITITTSTVATLGTGTAGDGVYVFVDASTGRITLGSAATNTAAINCDANCDVVSGAGFRADSIPLYQWPVNTAGVWDAFQPIFDKRAAASTAPVTAGNNIAVLVANGKQTISYDPTAGFNAVTCSGSTALAESGSTVFKITLTGNCTASSAAPLAGQTLTFLICQDATGGRTFTWPGNYHGTMTIGSTASKCSAQAFAGNGTDYYAVSAGVSNQ